MSAGEARGKLAAGLWIPHARGVYLSAEHQMTDMARLRIAVAATGGVVDRTAAAWLLGFLPDLPDIITLSIPRSAHGAAHGAVDTSCKRRSLPSEDVMATRGVPVTREALTLLQLASALAIDEAITIIDRAVQTERVLVHELRASLDRNSGAHGMRLARVLVAAAEDDSESEAERLFVRLLKQYRISGWVQQQWINGVRMDFVWPELGIVVSVHGWMFHRRYDRWDRDLRTANMLGLMGLLPLSFPWKRLRFEEESVVRELVAAIESRQSVD
ncbi:hypothetical protein [Gordonia sp. MP11Mi]